MKKILLLCAITVFVLAACSKADNDDKEVFVAPKDYVNVVQVTINPVVNLYIDKDDVILAVEYVNQDASDTYEIAEDKIVGTTLSEGIEVVVDTAVESGYLADEDKKITVDIIESREETDAEIKNKELLNTVLESVKKAAVNNDINVNVIGNSQGEQVWDVEVEAETTEGKPITEESTTEELTKEEPTSEEPTTEKLTKEEPTSEEPTTEKPTKEEPITEESATEESIAEKPSDTTAEVDKTNPQIYLKIGVPYVATVPVSDEEITVMTITFDGKGGYVEGEAPYMLIKYMDDADEIVYDGKTWYEAGGGAGGYSEVVITDSEIITDYEVFKLNQDGTLEVIASKYNESLIGVIYKP